MGDLVAKRYPTRLFANLADHTYVECGTGGKAWACWGGKTGGTELRRATGSTVRADEIAEPGEHAATRYRKRCSGRTVGRVGSWECAARRSISTRARSGTRPSARRRR